VFARVRALPDLVDVTDSCKGLLAALGESQDSYQGMPLEPALSSSKGMPKVPPNQRAFRRWLSAN